MRSAQCRIQHHSLVHLVLPSLYFSDLVVLPSSSTADNEPDGCYEQPGGTNDEGRGGLFIL